MKYMLILRATDDALENFANVEFEEIMNAMGQFNDELIRAGVLLAAEGLDPEPASGVVVDFTGEAPVVSDGPYGETKELFGGFYMLDVATIDDAVAWAKRVPYAEGCKIEIRRVTTIDEFPQDNEWIKKERVWREATGQL
jgi:hypothetical protein